MPKLAANLTMMFNEVPFLDRFRAAADAGFSHVEYMFPYEYPPDELKRRLREHGLVQVLHNMPAGNWAKGDRGVACQPDRVAEFRAGIAASITYASTLGCTQVNCLAGLRPPELGEALARRTFIENLAWAAPRLKAAGIRLLIESVNTRDVPGFFLTGTAQAVDIIEAVGSDNLFIQHDLYHMQIMEGDLAPTIERHLSRIGHMQVADTPGRHEPGTGEINYRFLFDVIDRAGYAGWIGCEYTPASTTLAGLGWATPYLT